MTSSGTATLRPYDDPAAGDDSLPDEADLRVMSMLEGHVPLALLCDLTAVDGPLSAEILAEEGEPDSAWWRQ
jgi:hypothetical protein